MEKGGKGEKDRVQGKIWNGEGGNGEEGSGWDTMCILFFCIEWPVK